MRKRKPSATLQQEIDATDLRGGVVDGEQGKAEVLAFCDLLNADDAEMAGELQRLADAWLESGQNFERLTATNPELRRILSKTGRICWSPSATGNASLILRFDFADLAEVIGEERVSREDEEGYWIPSPEAEALKAFFFFSLNPKCSDLAGRCDRCERYFVKGRRSNKRYCSQACGSAATAVASMQERIKNERKKRLEDARAAIREWNTLKSHRGKDFGAWLGRWELSKHFVTRHANELPKVKGAA